jgi:hypothetical protein
MQWHFLATTEGQMKKLIYVCIAFASAQTCADIYRLKAKENVYRSLSIGSAILMTGGIYLMLAPIQWVFEGGTFFTVPRDRRTVATLLDAATFLSNLSNLDQKLESSVVSEDGQPILQEELGFSEASANTIVDQYFNKYIKRLYSHSDITREIIIDRLAYLNIEGVEFDLCHDMRNLKMLTLKILE